MTSRCRKFIPFVVTFREVLLLEKSRFKTLNRTYCVLISNCCIDVKICSGKEGSLGSLEKVGDHLTVKQKSLAFCGEGKGRRQKNSHPSLGKNGLLKTELTLSPNLKWSLKNDDNPQKRTELKELMSTC